MGNKSIDGFQKSVETWMHEVFGDKIATDMLERIMRFLEEAIELAQAEGMTQEEVSRVVKYVFGREVGECNQEVGGCIVTLAAYCSKKKLSLQDEASREFNRINSPQMREKIFSKQTFKRSKGLTSETFRKNGDFKQQDSQDKPNVASSKD